MGLKSFYESLDEVPEALRDHYAEDKGKFVLIVDDIDDHPKVRGVITANKANVIKRDEYKAKLADAEAKLAELPEDFDAEKWVELNANANKDDPAKKDEQLQSMKAVYEGKLTNLQKKYETDMAARTAELQERDGYIDKTTKFDVLRNALREVGVDKDFEDAVVDHLSPSVKVQRTDDGSRKSFVETDLGEIGVQEFVKDWAQTKGKKFLTPPTGHAPNGNDGHQRGGKLPAGDFGGNKAERVKALASKFPELAAQ